MSFKVTDGKGSPVVGATVTPVGIAPLNTDVNGVASFSQDILGKNISVSHAADGFVLRETTVAADGATSLWQEDQDYLQALVYHEWAPGQRLTRPDPGSTMTLSVSDEIAADGQVMDTLSASIGEIATKIGITISLVASGGQLTMVVNPSDPLIGTNLAINKLRLQGNHLRGGDIVFAAIDDVRRSDLALHELGHSLGWGHSQDPRDVMCVTYQRNNHGDITISPRLGALWRMMAVRKVGQSFPDNDQGVSGVDRGPTRTMVIACR